MATTADTLPGAASAAPEDTLPVGLKHGWATGAIGISLLMHGNAGVM